jgi:hypothetical protein
MRRKLGVGSPDGLRLRRLPSEQVQLQDGPRPRQLGLRTDGQTPRLQCSQPVDHQGRRTAEFEPELRACFGQASNDPDILPGGIVISPTRNIPGSKRRNVGHVGLVGAGKGGARLIYSNSSARARLEQNYTVSTWTKRYRDTKGLSVLFYPLPLKSVPMIS